MGLDVCTLMALATCAAACLINWRSMLDPTLETEYKENFYPYNNRVQCLLVIQSTEQKTTIFTILVICRLNLFFICHRHRNANE